MLSHRSCTATRQSLHGSSLLAYSCECGEEFGGDSGGDFHTLHVSILEYSHAESADVGINRSEEEYERVEEH